MKLAEAVRQRRLELGITQEDVVVRAREADENISLGTVRGVEQGNRKSLRSGPKRGLAAGLSWPPEHLDHLIADQFRAECEACVEAVRDRTLYSAPAPATLPEGSALTAIFGMLSDDQRRALLRGARAWVEEHPEYANELAFERHGLEAIEDLDPAAFAELTMDERVTLMTHLAQKLLGPRAEAASS